MRIEDKDRIPNKDGYPDKYHELCMLLVDMLNEKSSWHDKERIYNALFTIRLQAKSMKAESDMFAKSDERDGRACND